MPVLVDVGGHGGSGIHADIDDKYREIVNRTSVHAVPQVPHPYVSMSPRTPQQLHQTVDARSGQALDSRQIGGLSRYDRELRRTTNTATDNISDNTQHAPRVEQVNVPKCTVCTLL